MRSTGLFSRLLGFTARSGTENRVHPVWTPLQNQLFRRLWLSSIVSGCAVAAHDMAVTWTINHQADSSFVISLIATFASLPFFLCTLPAGALADVVDRRRLMFWTNAGLGCVAAALAVLSSLNLLCPQILLTSVFLMGAGFAFNAPAWTATIPEIVSPEDLPSATTLGGLQMNIASLAGPAIGGLLLPFVGAAALFAVNAVGFALVCQTISTWQPNYCRLPLERFFNSIGAAVRYVRYAPYVRVMLLRQAIFGLFIATIPALLPVLVLRTLKLGPVSLGSVFTMMSVGSIFGAVWAVPQARARLSPNALTNLASLILATALTGMAFSRDLVLLFPSVMLAGIGWTLAASELWVAGQRSMPEWARGRMVATHIMVSQGGIALGGLICGGLANGAGVQVTLWLAAILLVGSILLSIPLSIDVSTRLNFHPSPLTQIYHQFPRYPKPQEGPITVLMEFQVRPDDRPRFLELLREMRLAFLRNGGLSCRVNEDLEHPGTICTEMLISSWAEHIGQHERMTQDEKGIWDQLMDLHLGSLPPPTKHFVAIDDEMFTRPRRPAPTVPSA